jgi:hypothetical protein
MDEAADSHRHERAYLVLAKPLPSTTVMSADDIEAFMDETKLHTDAETGAQPTQTDAAVARKRFDLRQCASCVSPTSYSGCRTGLAQRTETARTGGWHNPADGVSYRRGNNRRGLRKKF